MWICGTAAPTATAGPSAAASSSACQACSVYATPTTTASCCHAAAAAATALRAVSDASGAVQRVRMWAAHLPGLFDPIDKANQLHTHSDYRLLRYRYEIDF